MHLSGHIAHGQANSIATLDGQAGDTLLLQGVGELYYEWSVGAQELERPEAELEADKFKRARSRAYKRQALDLELRARIVSTTTTELKSPVIRWRLEWGHGATIMEYPPTRQQSVSAAQYQGAILPARGLTLRLSARQLRIYMTGGFDLQEGDVAASSVMVSVQPSVASQRLTVPYQQLILGDVQQAFPGNADEFRIRRADSRPFFAGACAVTMLGILDEPLSVSDVAAAGFGDWSPIPPMAAACSIDAAAAALEFR